MTHDSTMKQITGYYARDPWFDSDLSPYKGFP